MLVGHGAPGRCRRCRSAPVDRLDRMVLTHAPGRTERPGSTTALLGPEWGEPLGPGIQRNGSRKALLDQTPRTRAWHQATAVATYLAVSFVLWTHVWVGGNPAHAITCNCGDTVQQVWWLEWLPWAITHGHNPLLTNALWSRMGGVNALTNTSWFAPAAVLAPITLLFGPIASFNVANLLAPVLSGWAAFALAGRFSSRIGARLVAGGLYAFSPYMLRNTVLGHIDLTITAYLPLVLLLGLQLLSHYARPIRIGLWLGLLTITQFFTGLEVLALTAVTGSLCALGVVICRPKTVAAARKQLLTAAAVGASITAVVLAYPLWFYLAGLRHVAGPFWPVSSSSPWGLFTPGSSIFSVNTGLSAVGYLGPQGPNTDFLGIGLLLFVIVTFPLWRRQRSSVIVAYVAVVSWVLEFFPGRLWTKLPLLSSIELVRFALPVSLCIGPLLARSIDGWWGATGRWRPTRRSTGRRRGARMCFVALLAAAFIPLVDTYSVPFRVTTATVPPWFQKDASHLAEGTVVLTIPIAYSIASQPMAWQAETHDAFDLIGGWAFVPGGNGVDDEIVSHLRGPVAALRAVSGDPLGVTTAEQETIRAARPLVIVVIPEYAEPGTTGVMTAIVGFPPTWTDGAWVWTLHQ